MYIWFAADARKDLGQIQERMRLLCGEGDIFNPALTLPIHISLRISCRVDDSVFDQIADRAAGYLGKQKPFLVQIRGMEINGGIVWIKMEENQGLHGIHQELVRMMEEFGIGPQPYDLCFLYHATLYSGEAETAERVFQELRKETLPGTISVDRFFIGCSESGRAGEYRVIREICV